MFRDFLGFLVAAGLLWSQVSTSVMLAFMEHHHLSSMSPSNVTNYLTDIRSMMILYGDGPSCLWDQTIPLKEMDHCKLCKIERK